MTDSLRDALRWRRVRTGSGLVLALAVAAFVVLPVLGLVLALLALIGLVVAQVASRKREERP